MMPVMIDGLIICYYNVINKSEMSEQSQPNTVPQEQPIIMQQKQMFKHTKSKSLKLIKHNSLQHQHKMLYQTQFIKQHKKQSIYPSSNSSEKQEWSTTPLKQDAKFMQRYNQLNSLPVNRISSAASQKSTLEPIAQQFIKIKQRINTNSALLHKCQQIVKDKQKFPIKYKIAEEFGFNQEKIFKMKDADIRMVQQEYMKQKGIQYLQESRQISKIRRKLASSKTEPREEDKNRPLSYFKKKDPNYVREIFKEAAVIAKAREQVKLRRQDSQKKLQLKLKQMSERQDLLGFVVYAKTHKHMKKIKKKELGYLQQLKSEQKIDESIIQFIRSKVKRVKTQAK